METFTEVFVWGSDHCGQLGLGGLVGKNYPSPRLCSFNVLIKEISCGEEHAGFISSMSHVYTMGSNSEGRLGIDDKCISYSSSPCLVDKLSRLVPLKIACGWGHTAVVTNNGNVFTWGLGEFGALGLGDDTSQWAPVKMQLPLNFEASSVSCGSRHTAILGNHGKLAMVGCGEAGQLGTRKREKELVPVLIEGENIIQVACGVFHTAYLNKKGAVYTMGGNSFGQLGHGNKKSTSSAERVKALDGIYITKIACGYHSAAICDKGNLYVWGSGTFGEYLLPEKVHLQSRAKDISIGSTFSVVLCQDMNLFAWGNNSNGELGLSDLDPRTHPTAVVGLVGKKVSKVACGGSFCIVLGSDVGRSKTPSHTRSYSKSEYVTEHTKFQKKSEEHQFKHHLKAKNNSKEHAVEDFQRNEHFILEENFNNERSKNILLRNELDESVSQLSRIKAEFSLKQQNFEFENSRIKAENHEFSQRLQELQTDLKSFTNENKIIKEENYKLKRDFENFKHSYSAEIEEKAKSAFFECEKLYRELEQEKNNTQNEYHLRCKSENSLQQVTEEKNKLVSQVESLCSEISSLQKELKFTKEEESHKKSQISENFSKEIYEKNLEIEKLSINYHELMIQFNRLVEENKIFRQSINELEEKNKKLFENLEKELTARAHDYKERTLYLLNTPIIERENRRSVSPVHHLSPSHRRVGSMQTSENYQISENAKVPATEKVKNNVTFSRTKLSETTQAKIGNTAARLLARMENESALANMRISSPSRRSPDRPVPFTAHKVSREIRDILKSRLLEYRE